MLWVSMKAPSIPPRPPYPPFPLSPPITKVPCMTAYLSSAVGVSPVLVLRENSTGRYVYVYILGVHVYVHTCTCTCINNKLTASIVHCVSSLQATSARFTAMTIVDWECMLSRKSTVVSYYCTLQSSF